MYVCTTVGVGDFSEFLRSLRFPLVRPGIGEIESVK